MVNSKTVVRGITLLAALLVSVAMSGAQSAPRIFAQQLVDETTAQHPELLVVVFHVTPPGKTENVFVACNFTNCLGHKSGKDDLSVINDNLDRIHKFPMKGEIHIGVNVPLKDQTGKIIGAFGMALQYHQGDKDSQSLKLAEEIRDSLQQRIPSLESLFEPAK